MTYREIPCAKKWEFNLIHKSFWSTTLHLFRDLVQIIPFPFGYNFNWLTSYKGFIMLFHTSYFWLTRTLLAFSTTLTPPPSWFLLKFWLLVLSYNFCMSPVLSSHMVGWLSCGVFTHISFWFNSAFALLFPHTHHFTPCLDFSVISIFIFIFIPPFTPNDFLVFMWTPS